VSVEIEKCSFCGKSARQVRKLISGPDVRICNECVGLCVSILDEESIEETPSQTAGTSGFKSAGGYGYVVPTIPTRAEPDGDGSWPTKLIGWPGWWTGSPGGPGDRGTVPVRGGPSLA
jgi:hypothetical protein